MHNIKTSDLHSLYIWFLNIYFILCVYINTNWKKYLILIDVPIFNMESNEYDNKKTIYLVFKYIFYIMYIYKYKLEKIFDIN
jgi:hypothetical protein